MKIAELVKSKNAKVRVTVPSRLQQTLGDTIEGTVVGLVPKGSSVTLVKVKVPRRGDHLFRPQDLTLVS